MVCSSWLAMAESRIDSRAGAATLCAWAAMPRASSWTWRRSSSGAAGGSKVSHGLESALMVHGLQRGKGQSLSAIGKVNVVRTTLQQYSHGMVAGFAC